MCSENLWGWMSTNSWVLCELNEMWQEIDLWVQICCFFQNQRTKELTHSTWKYFNHTLSKKKTLIFIQTSFFLVSKGNFFVLVAKVVVRKTWSAVLFYLSRNTKIDIEEQVQNCFKNGSSNYCKMYEVTSIMHKIQYL